MQRLLDVAAEAVGDRLPSLTRPAALARTEVLQPILTALCAGVSIELAERGVCPDVVAGHSVGELAACIAAGAIEAERGVLLAATRGQLMAREASRQPGAMLALRATADELDALVTAGSAAGRLCLAVHNAPDEWVLSGEASALRAVSARWMTTLVPTPGAWHSPLMAGAVREYEDALRQSVTADLRVPIVCNRTATTVRDARELPALLAAQLTHPVRWAECMTTLASMEVDRAIACGPARSLRRFASASAPGIDLTVIALPDDLDVLTPSTAP